MTYKCQKCGNKKSFDIVSYGEIWETYDQENDEYGDKNYGYTTRDLVICSECNTKVENNHLGIVDMQQQHNPIEETLTQYTRVLSKQTKKELKDILLAEAI